jgi:hypothetical protein
MTTENPAAHRASAPPSGGVARTLKWVDDRLATLRVHAVVAWLIPAGVFLTVMLIGLSGSALYERLIREDGPIEWATALLAVMAAFVAAAVSFGLWTRGAPRWLAVCWGILAVGLFLLAGEEVSWGQRQIGFSGPDALTARNNQGESNVHNLLSPWALSATYTAVGVYGAGVGHALLRRIPRVGEFADLLAPSWRSVAAPWFGVHAVVYAWYSVVEPIVRAAGVDFAMDDHLRKLGEPSELVLGVGFLLFVVDSLVRVKLDRRSATQPRLRRDFG